MKLKVIFLVSGGLTYLFLKISYYLHIRIILIIEIESSCLQNGSKTLMKK